MFHLTGDQVLAQFMDGLVEEYHLKDELVSTKHDDFIAVKVCNSANPTQLGFADLHTNV